MSNAAPATNSQGLETGMALSSDIRRARMRKGFSQVELANLLGITRSAVANWEGGITLPCSAHLQKLALVTDVSYEWLATGRGTPALQQDWTPVLDADIVDDPDERKLLLAYRASTGATRRKILEFVASTSSAARRVVANRSALPRRQGK